MEKRKVCGCPFNGHRPLECNKAERRRNSCQRTSFDTDNLCTARQRSTRLIGLVIIAHPTRNCVARKTAPRPGYID